MKSLAQSHGYETVELRLRGWSPCPSATHASGSQSSWQVPITQGAFHKSQGPETTFDQLNQSIWTVGGGGRYQYFVKIPRGFHDAAHLGSHGAILSPGTNRSSSQKNSVAAGRVPLGFPICNPVPLQLSQTRVHPLQARDRKVLTPQSRERRIPEGSPISSPQSQLEFQEPTPGEAVVKLL